MNLIHPLQVKVEIVHGVLNHFVVIFQSFLRYLGRTSDRPSVGSTKAKGRHTGIEV
jgi:hypothetical protein